MAILIAVCLFLMGWSCGYFIGLTRDRETGREAPESGEKVQMDPTEIKRLRQIENWLNYDGTGRGQKELE